jgi:hypothetical protein
MKDSPQPKLMHIAKIFSDAGSYSYLLLKQLNPHLYSWFSLNKNNEEIETSVSGSTVEEAIQKARIHWRKDSFKTIQCGFRYTLPERDEHGMNAYFHQMEASYRSMNGVYFDEELGHNCFVQNASEEAKNLLYNLYRTVRQ